MCRESRHPKWFSFMKFVYIDDTSDNADFALMAAVIVPESQFRSLERFLAFSVQELLPEEQHEGFEFHASALFNGKSPFDKISHDVAIKLFHRFADALVAMKVPIIYGGVNLRALRRSYYSTAQPLDVAFRSCMTGIDKWFQKDRETEHPNNDTEMGMLICDDTSNAGLKKNLQQTYRHWRGKADGDFRVSCGLADYLHDDMYFGDSAHSIGIQLADMTAYIILRHLQNQPETEDMFQAIKPTIFYGETVPEQNEALQRREKGDVVSLRKLIDEAHQKNAP